MTVIPIEKRENTKPRAPAHLRPSTQAWYRSVLEQFELEPHHRHLLVLAAEALDRGQQAREALAERGLTYMDSHGCPHPMPEVAIERDSRLAYARLLRELDLDTEAPSAPTGRRPPSLRSNRRA
jgi:phage terminase small subunit